MKAIIVAQKYMYILEALTGIGTQPFDKFDKISSFYYKNINGVPGVTTF